MSEKKNEKKNEKNAKSGSKIGSKIGSNEDFWVKENVRYLNEKLNGKNETRLTPMTRYAERIGTNDESDGSGGSVRRDGRETSGSRTRDSTRE